MQVTKVTWEVSGYIDAPVYKPGRFMQIIQKLGGIIKMVQ